MNRAHAGALQLALEPEIEVGRVDADEQRHARAQAGARRSSRRMRKSSGRCATTSTKPRTASFSMRKPHLAAGRLHPRTGDAGEAHVGMARAHGVDQRRRQRVAGGFAGDDADGDRALASAHRSTVASC